MVSHEEEEHWRQGVDFSLTFFDHYIPFFNLDRKRAQPAANDLELKLHPSAPTNNRKHKAQCSMVALGIRSLLGSGWVF